MSDRLEMVNRKDRPVVHYEMSIRRKGLRFIQLTRCDDKLDTLTLNKFDTVSSGAGENAKLI
jgi:hypothetical protein